MTENNNTAKLADMAYVYAKNKESKNFRGFDLEGWFVGNLIYASLLEDSEENHRTLQELADTNKKDSWMFQLRKGNKVVFQTV